MNCERIDHTLFMRSILVCPFHRLILDFRYIGIFHILSIFIILGIGADDVFIFFDAWKETAYFEVCLLSYGITRKICKAHVEGFRQ